MRILIALSLLVFGRLSAQDTVIVRGLPWSVVAVEMDSTWGMCDDPATEGREIWIDPRLSEEHELEICLHELLHAAFWDIDESVIEQVAKDFARVLWRMGYRKQDEKG